MTDTELKTLLTQQKEHLDVLLSLLRQEISAISDRNIDELESSSQTKVQCLEKLQSLDQQVAQHPMLAAHKEADWFKQAISILEEQLDACKQQNEVNRLALEQSQINLQQFKNELLQLHGKSGLTYNRKGKPAVDSKGKGFKA
ncbi:flagellar protein FlgN [Alkalimonas collagenimarina]|uniref:Flagellar protein FlgN n=1 Tax=Alkalimonas collagenimarina TaxID=400390 RepID=A0ABT9GYV4_9GAMM|nr:flagellar protein FlgN [Alkalimonas collagenimarina]MDP4535870.1 flagellar protein FlgN [Alkalimonas collagenimarina]